MNFPLKQYDWQQNDRREGTLKTLGESRQEIEEQRARLSKLSETSVRVSESPDADTVMREIVDSAPASPSPTEGPVKARDACRAIAGTAIFAFAIGGSVLLLYGPPATAWTLIGAAGASFALWYWLWRRP